MSKSGNLSGLENRVLSHVGKESEAVRIREQKIASLELQLRSANLQVKDLENKLKSSHRVIKEQGEQKAQLLVASRDTTSLSALYRGNEQVMAVIEELLAEMRSNNLNPRDVAEKLMGVIWGHRLKLLAQEPTEEMLTSGRFWTRRYPQEMDLQRAIWKAMYDAA